MKIKIYLVESFTTTVTRGSIEIDSDNYPELDGMSEDEISNYIDDNVWEMKPINDEVYSSLGEEVSDQYTEYDNIGDETQTYYVERVTE